MSGLDERRISCPYCGESIDILIELPEQDAIEDAIEYIEDCQVCCRPIKIQLLSTFDGYTEVRVFHENE